uniref:ATP-dependent zinc metalloprotease FtsH n=1 Tax=Thermotoga maritima (strain ATCC 43589 / DSM 3109 / JCM 10099 / NBRC 100826 / MSB8) TaxID=243274 RepID=UPI0004F13E4D|nr:Chain A, ATP-dependent zinc metalloprotease FtsH [Thermotoga maritima MSB8]4M8A_B Chain B, ATP-dependent zinc metalloprotease FtsH [Thermotoga maritima MSB8]4M8A_C Chain C, ATP-dependent zinc metalloprotease FtsH [Thermotoga maritima MSB8]
GAMGSKLSYTSFVQMVEDERSVVSEVVIRDDGVLRVYTKDGRVYEVDAPWAVNDSQLIEKLVSKGIKVSGER